jgi:hypothetical protein
MMSTNGRSYCTVRRMHCDSLWRCFVEIDVAPAVQSGWVWFSRDGPDDEAGAVYGRADHRGFEGARSGRGGDGSMPQARDQRGNFDLLSKNGVADLRRRFAYAHRDAQH